MFRYLLFFCFLILLLNITKQGFIFHGSHFTGDKSFKIIFSRTTFIILKELISFVSLFLLFLSIQKIIAWDVKPQILRVDIYERIMKGVILILCLGTVMIILTVLLFKTDIHSFGYLLSKSKYISFSKRNLYLWEKIITIIWLISVGTSLTFFSVKLQHEIKMRITSFFFINSGILIVLLFPYLKDIIKLLNL